MPVLVMWEQLSIDDVGGGGNLDTTNNTVGQGAGTYEINAGASTIAFSVSDDDLTLDDGSFPVGGEDSKQVFVPPSHQQ